jgi:hypothetical protein
MMAQMADRCYLEKCRDRLYPEFVLGGVAVSRWQRGELKVIYGSGLDVLRSTPSSSPRRCARGSTASSAVPIATRGALRRSQPVHGGDRREPRVPEADPAERSAGRCCAARPLLHWEKNPLQNMRTW